MLKKPYFTRKDLIVLSLSMFYSLLLLFVGACLLTGESKIFASSNPVLSIGAGFNFYGSDAGLSGILMLILIALYVTVIVGGILFARRYTLVNGYKPYNWRAFIAYFIIILASVILSFGVGSAVHIILGLVMGQDFFGEVIPDYVDLLSYIGQSLALTTMIYAVLATLIGGVLMFVVNFILVDKPFKMFDKKNEPIIDDEIEAENNSVLDSFDVNESELNATNNINGVGGAGGAGGAGTGEGAFSLDNTVEALDDRERVFPELSKMDVQYEGYAVETIPTDDVSLEELCTKFRNYLAKEEGLYFEEDTIRFFISGLGTSHFQILEGLSGTGKSSLPRYFAKFTNSNVLFMPVQATWRDKTNLVGYFNEFSKRYAETDFLTELYHANYDPDRLHFFVLDEMNISRVEYYFADLLSVLEYPEDEWKLRLMHFPFDFIPPARLYDGCIKIPNNSYFVGTANKDDSTFTITDKVYDRAITIDFSYRNAPFKVSEEVSTINLSASKFHSLVKEAKEATENHLTSEDYEKIEKLTNFIYESFDITFGNRILNQIENLVPVFVACGGTKEDALDFLLSRKVLAKVEGRFEEYVKDALKQFLTLLNKTYGKGVFKRCEATVNSLMRRL